MIIISTKVKKGKLKEFSKLYVRIQDYDKKNNLPIFIVGKYHKPLIVNDKKIISRVIGRLYIDFSKEKIIWERYYKKEDIESDFIEKLLKDFHFKDFKYKNF